MTITFREVTPNDSTILLEWRNDPLTRNNSISMEEVHKDDHEKWLEGVLVDPNVKLLIALFEGNEIGTVRGKKDSAGEWYISWTVSPNQRGKGLGKQMVKAFVSTLSGSIKAIVKDGNVASSKIATYAGLEQISEENGIVTFLRR